MPHEPKTTTPAIPRPLDVPQRAKVRDLLDGHFDVTSGRYAEGWSDQRIGTEVVVPWASVAQLRELAYGPLKADPHAPLRKELEAIATEIAAISGKMGQALDGIAGLEKEMEAAKARVDSLTHKIAALDR